MHVKPHPALAGRPEILRAREILTGCVHCGFCTDACPSYQVLGDELDSPRGRIYLIRGLLETGRAHPQLQTHLDLCLTCRACETACPSGVEYGELLEVGRRLTERQLPRRPADALLRWCLGRLVANRRILAPLLRAARPVRALLPAWLTAQLPRARPAPPAWPAPLPKMRDGERLLLPDGCVQGVATPHTNSALAHLAAHFGARPLRLPQLGCCGSLRLHLADEAGAVRHIKDWIDKVWRLYQAEAEGKAAPLTILVGATGCETTILDYPRLLRRHASGADQAEYVRRAELLVGRVRDPADWLAERLAADSRPPPDERRVALHEPCSLQHGLGRKGGLQGLLTLAGVTPLVPEEAGLCCGSAGSYSLLQPEVAARLRARKLAQLEALQPDLIVTANVGCQLFLDAAASRPVVHWLELLADRLGVQPLQLPPAGGAERPGA